MAPSEDGRHRSVTRANNLHATSAAPLLRDDTDARKDATSASSSSSRSSASEDTAPVSIGSHAGAAASAAFSFSAFSAAAFSAAALSASSSLSRTLRMGAAAAMARQLATDEFTSDVSSPTATNESVEDTSDIGSHLLCSAAIRAATAASAASLSSSSRAICSAASRSSASIWRRDRRAGSSLISFPYLITTLGFFAFVAASFSARSASSSASALRAASSSDRIRVSSSACAFRVASSASLRASPSCFAASIAASRSASSRSRSSR